MSDQLVAETSTCTTHNTHNRLTSMPQVGFKPTFSAGERPQTYALDRAADGFGGLVVSMLASGTRVRGFKPGRSR